MSTIFQSQTENFKQLISNGHKYSVPKFQRDYSWEKENWEDLWNDIFEENSDDYHYMGYLVLKTIPDKDGEFEIVDGQQRMTTITLLILTFLNQVKKLAQNGADKEDKEMNMKIYEKNYNDYIGYQHPITLFVQPKLSLNRNNRAYFRDLCQGHTLPIKTTMTNQLLSKASKFFSEKVGELHLKTGADFIEKILDFSPKLIFTVIRVNSDIQGYKIFETLNARGVQLSVPDLIKNHLFSSYDKYMQEMGKDAEEALEADWEIITQNLGKEDFSRFIKAHWNSHYSDMIDRKNTLFRKIQKHIQNDKVTSYIGELKESSEIYAALQDYEHLFWKENDLFTDKTEIIKQSLYMLNVFGIIQPQVILLSAYSKFKDNIDLFISTLKYLEVIAVRYNIIGNRQTNVQENIYNKIASKIRVGEIATRADIRQALKDLYVSDEEFIASFQNKNFSKNALKKVRYLLTRIEKELNHSVDVFNPRLSLEHILPQNVSNVQDWSEFNENHIEEHIDFIGNMTIMDKGDNKDLGAKTFKDKKEFYQKSTFKITKHCATYDDWSPEAIKERGQWLAEQAKEVWKINYHSE